MLFPIKMNHPELSFADIWMYAGCMAIELSGGPNIPFRFGRTDATTGMACPPSGLLPDPSKGADHLRDVFNRMGFNDREIVALNGINTLGHEQRSRAGFEGPWTRDPNKFDNAFFKNLSYLEWRPRRWDGPLQYEDVQTGELMMLPSDIALLYDPRFRDYVELYAKDQDAFFRDFAAAFSKLLHLGMPDHTATDNTAYSMVVKEKSGAASDKFRAEAGSGRLWMCEKLWRSGEVDVHAVDPQSGRTALHKAALSGHDHVIDFLLKECN
jgi:catalase (peroxidase I)